MEPTADGEHGNFAHIFHGIVEQSVAGIYLLQDGVMQYVNKQFADFFGTTPQRLTGRPLAEISPPSQRRSLVAQYENRVAGRDPDGHFIIRADVRNQGMRSIEIHGRQIEYRQRPAVVGIGIDVTERIEAHRKLVESRTQLRNLMSAVETIQDTERAHIAMELHDEIGGLLTALKFEVTRLRLRLESAGESRVEPQVPELIRLTREISGLAQEAIGTVRRISDELRPPLVEELDLFEGIGELVTKFRARYGIVCSLDLPLSASDADPSTELDLFRIIQEALTNVARHARANTLWVRLDRIRDDLRLTIDDDGVGFTPPATSTSREVPSEGLGLVGIRERARRIGGTCTINDSDRGGVRIEVQAPWSFKQ